MIFKRREKPPLFQRLWRFMWPERGFGRAWLYLRRRIERLNDHPGTIALGVACGVFTSFTPLFGLHFIVAALIAYLLRGNLLAALLGTGFGNPLTFPVIATASMSTGSSILGIDHSGDGDGVIDRFLDIGGVLWDGFLSALGLAEPGAVTWAEAFSKFGDFASEVVLPYTVGGVIWGVPVAIATYFIARPMIAAYQKRRRDTIARRRVKLARPRVGKRIAEPAG